MLKQRCDEARPAKLKQFYYDRRNGRQFYIAVNTAIMVVLTRMTILFGIVQIALASVQVRQDSS